MFKFLKEKLKKAVSKFSRDVDEEAEDIVAEAASEEAVDEKKENKKKEKKEEKVSEPEPEPELEEEKEEEPEPEEDQEEVEEEKAEKTEEEKPSNPEQEPEPEEEKEAEPELSAELKGLKEGLDTYPDDDLDSLMNILGFPSEMKNKTKEEKIGLVLTKPLLEINSAMDRLDEIHKEPEPQPVDKKEEREEKDEKVPTAEQLLEEESEEEVPPKPPEDTEPKEEKVEVKEELPPEPEPEPEPEPAPKPQKEEPEEKKEEKKGGFFKRLFKSKQKEEEEQLLREINEKEKEEKEAKVEEKPEEEEEEKPPEAGPELEEKKLAEKAPEPEHEELKEEEKVEEKEEVKEELPPEPEPETEPEQEPEEEPEEKKGFFGKIKQSFELKKLSESKFENIFFDLELALLENNVAVEVIEKIKEDMRSRLVDQKIKRSQIENIVLQSLRKSMDQILSVKGVDLLGNIYAKKKENKPYVIVFVGINGSGKTTTIAKMAKYFMNNGLKTVMVASDTFRAAAIQQLEEHANNLGVKLIKHDYGSDPAAVAFDGIRYAESRSIDVVLIDTAGRLHSNVNLMDEMKKIMRVAKPDMKIFIGESITGNDCIEQAQRFNEAVEIDGIVLSKADVDEKGGAALSVSYVTGKPILFLGTGQTYEDLQAFDKKVVLGNLGLA